MNKIVLGVLTVMTVIALTLIVCAIIWWAVTEIRTPKELGSFGMILLTVVILAIFLYDEVLK